jgi:PadR family transcriptional regulator, regulatory protein PadR
MLRITLQVQLVLRTLLGDPHRELYGLEFVDATGLPPGTIYPILARLEAAGWIDSRWEEVDQHAEGRPRRRYYRLTSDGATQSATALSAADARRRRTHARGVVGKVLPGGAS